VEQEKEKGRAKRDGARTMGLSGAHRKRKEKSKAAVVCRAAPGRGIELPWSPKTGRGALPGCTRQQRPAPPWKSSEQRSRGENQWQTGGNEEPEQSGRDAAREREDYGFPLLQLKTNHRGKRYFNHGGCTKEHAKPRRGVIMKILFKRPGSIQGGGGPNGAQKKRRKKPGPRREGSWLQRPRRTRTARSCTEERLQDLSKRRATGLWITFMQAWRSPG